MCPTGREGERERETETKNINVISKNFCMKEEIDIHVYMCVHEMYKFDIKEVNTEEE